MDVARIRWLIFGLPPAEIAVHPSERNDVHEFYLMCDDVDALVAEMSERMIAEDRPCTARAFVMAVLAGAIAACAPNGDPAYEFALIGDIPYLPEEVPQFEVLIDDVNGRGGIEWVIHVGDIQYGPCTDEVLRGRFDLFQRFAMPFVYTPGDNDWFDCDREAWGGFDEYERLEHLRGLFFPNPSLTTGGRPMEVRSQSLEPGFEEFVENVRWIHGNVVYSTVHLLGFLRAPTDTARAERRLDAALAWIAETFEVAREAGSAGVFISMQVDPWLVRGLPAVTRYLCPACLNPRTRLERLYPVLVDESLAFAGQVVLAVGDTHIFRVDKPLYQADGTLVENFTRVETFGSPDVHWVRVTVDSREREVFSFHQEIIPTNSATAQAP